MKDAMGAAQGMMFLGTASNVGKTSIALACTRYLSAQGVNVCPFKAVSVGRHAYQTASGEEIHVHQAQQAMAAGLDPCVEMNPVMFKTDADGKPTLMLRGTPVPMTHDIEDEARTARIRSVIREVYSSLAARHRAIVLEGCGSPVELNIKERDLANLWLAETFDIPCVLVVNAESAGTFSALIGTLSLMSAAEKRLVTGFIVNKFHGDTASFSAGVRILEDKTGLPCLGVVPFMPGLQHLGADEPLEAGPDFAVELEDEIERWTEHVIGHLDMQALEELALRRWPQTTARFGSYEPIWQGRVHLGDEPGVYGNAQYSGLCVDLPFSLQSTDFAGSSQMLICIEAEDVHVFSPYPGHKVSLVQRRPEDPGDPNGPWRELVLAEGLLTGDTLEILIDLADIEDAVVYMSVRVEVDTTLRAGLYDDFVFTRLSKRSTGFKYAASFGFMAP